MNNNNFLFNAILLLYRESVLSSISSSGVNSSLLITTLVSKVTPKSTNRRIGIEENLIRVINELLAIRESDNIIDKNMLIRLLNIELNKNEEILNVLLNEINEATDDTEIRNTNSAKALRMSIDRHLKNIHISEALRYSDVEFQKVKENTKGAVEFLTKLKMKIDKNMPGSETDSAILDEVDLSDVAGMSKLISDVRKNYDGVGIIRSGIQAINKATGGGHRPGEYVSIGGLEHSNKSGFSLGLAIDTVLFNTPNLINSNKKPLVGIISFEDNARIVLERTFNYLYCYKHGYVLKPEELIEMTDGEIAKFIYDNINVNGWEVKILRIDPTRFRFSDLQALIIKWESLGFEIKALLVDYLLKISDPTLTDSTANGQDKRILLRKTRNFCAERNILFISPKQLGPKANDLVKNGVGSLEQPIHVSKGGYYAESTQLGQDIDVEWFVAVYVDEDGNGWQSVKRGKHKFGGAVVSPKYTYFILPFKGTGPIMPDIDGDNSAYYNVKDMGSKRNKNEFIF